MIFFYKIRMKVGCRGVESSILRSTTKFDTFIFIAGAGRKCTNNKNDQFDQRDLGGRK